MHLIDVLQVSSSNWCIYLSSQVIRLEKIRRGFVASMYFSLRCLFDKCCDLVAGRHKSAAYLAQKAKDAGVTLDTVAYNTMLKANLESGIIDFLSSL